VGPLYDAITSRIGGYNSYDAPIVCYITFVSVAFKQPVTLIRLGYLAYLFFCFLMHVPGRIVFIKTVDIIPRTWGLITIYSLGYLCTVYCYQFRPIRDWIDNQWGDRWGITVTEVGLEMMENRIVAVLEMTAVVLLCIVQWRLFLIRGQEREQEEEGLRRSSLSAVLKKVNRMIHEQLDGEGGMWKKNSLKRAIHNWQFNRHEEQYRFIKRIPTHARRFDPRLNHIHCLTPLHYHCLTPLHCQTSTLIHTCKLA